MAQVMHGSTGQHGGGHVGPVTRCWQADMSTKDDCGRTAIDWAMRKKTTPIVKLLSCWKIEGKAAYDAISAAQGSSGAAVDEVKAQVSQILGECPSRDMAEGEALRLAACDGNVRALQVLMPLVHGKNAMQALVNLPSDTDEMLKFMLRVIATRGRCSETETVGLNVQHSGDTNGLKIHMASESTVAECLLQACLALTPGEQLETMFGQHQLSFGEIQLDVTRPVSFYEMRDEAVLLLSLGDENQVQAVHAVSNARWDLMQASTQMECVEAMANAQDKPGLKKEVARVQTKLDYMRSASAVANAEASTCLCLIQ